MAHLSLGTPYSFAHQASACSPLTHAARCHPPFQLCHDHRLNFHSPYHCTLPSTPRPQHKAHSLSIHHASPQPLPTPLPRRHYDSSRHTTHTLPNTTPSRDSDRGQPESSSPQVLVQRQQSHVGHVAAGTAISARLARPTRIAELASCASASLASPRPARSTPIRRSTVTSVLELELPLPAKTSFSIFSVDCFLWFDGYDWQGWRLWHDWHDWQDLGQCSCCSLHHNEEAL